MVLASLKEALSRVADTPVLWIPGIFIGSLFSLVFILQVRGSTVLGARAGFLGLVALPFFLGGAYGIIRGDGRDLRAYLSAGRRYYFRILLAGAVIVAAASLTILLVILPFTLAGGALQAAGSLALLSVSLSFAFFIYFFDTAVVLEDRKVLDSIRRSVEFTLIRPVETLVFYLVNMAIGTLILFLSAIIWSFFIADRLTPLMAVNQSTLQGMPADQLMSLVGPAGLWSGAAIGFFAVLFGGTILISFKACFFSRHATLSAKPPEGEFDEKGRFYRY